MLGQTVGQLVFVKKNLGECMAELAGFKVKFCEMACAVQFTPLGKSLMKKRFALINEIHGNVLIDTSRNVHVNAFQPIRKRLKL
jgi:hypothetical protein